MRFIAQYRFLKQISSLCCNRPVKGHDCSALIREYITLLADKRQAGRPLELISEPRVYSSDSKKNYTNVEKQVDATKDVFEHKKDRLRNTEHSIRRRGEEIVRDLKQQKEVTDQKLRATRQHIIQDILETKAKVQERLEGVVEKENPFTVPNVLCVARILMSPYVGYCVLQNNYDLALGLLVFAGVTDLLDGWIARRWKGQASKMGSFLDPLADKVLIASIFVTLTCQSLMPLPLTLLIVGRDAALVVSAFVIRYMSLPPPRTLSRYFDVTYATVQLAPTFVSKVNTAVQLLLVGGTLASPVFGCVAHPALHALCWLTAASTVVSAASYLVSKDTYTFLKKKS